MGSVFLSPLSLHGFLGSTPFLFLWALGSHPQGPWVPTLTISFFGSWVLSLSVFSSCLCVSCSHSSFPGFGMIYQSDSETLSSSEINLYFGFASLSPGNFFGVCCTHICFTCGLALSTNCTGLCGADGNSLITVAKRQAYDVNQVTTYQKNT